MPAGRHPKPTVVKMLEGNPGKRPLNMAEPVCAQPPLMPSHVAEDVIAADKWDEVIAAMPPGVYSRLDTALLATYAQAYATMVRASPAMQGELTITVFNEDGFPIGTKRNPAIDIWLDMATVVQKTAAALGLMPTVRAKLHVPEAAGKKSRLAGLIKQQ